MDKDRQFRMLIPPFFLFASVLWEAYLSGDLGRYVQRMANNTDPNSLKSVLSILGVLGVATLPIGYAIGVFTLSFLRSLRVLPLFPHRAYDVPISKHAMEKIWQKLGISKESKQSALCVAAVFDHVLLQRPIHEWLFRRWTTFNICTQCATSLVFSYALGSAFNVRPTLWWWITIGALFGIFIWQSIASWCETYEMFDLAVDVKAAVRGQSKRPEAAGAH